MHLSKIVQAGVSVMNFETVSLKAYFIYFLTQLNLWAQSSSQLRSQPTMP